MTVYVHFGDKTREINPVRLFNVESVTDDGVYAVVVKMQFGDSHRRFEGVSHVAIQTERQEGTSMTTFTSFATWRELLDAIAAWYTLFYRAPLDARPVLVSVIVRKDGRLRVTPPYGSGADVFTADEGHLSRFRKGGRS